MAEPQSVDLVVIGITGDLARKMIVPRTQCNGEARCSQGSRDRRCHSEWCLERLRRKRLKR